MDFMKMFKKGSDPAGDGLLEECVNPINLESLGLVEGIGPALTPDFDDVGLSMREYIEKWKTLYPLTESVDSVLEKLKELKKLVWSLPVCVGDGGDIAQGRKWYKLWNVDPVNDVKISELYWCNDINLFRYLRSFKFKVQQAFTMLRRTLAWRRFKKIDDINTDNVAISNTGGMVYRKGYDKSGKPVVYYRPSNEVDFDRERQVLLLFFMLELAMFTCLFAEGNDKVVLIVDLAKWSISKMPSLELVIDTVRASSDHYPGVVHDIIIIDPPMLMDPLMQMIKAVVDQQTAKKIVMKHRGSKLEAFLKNKIDVSQVEESMGGANKTHYDHDLYWPGETKAAIEIHERRNKWIAAHEKEWLESKKNGAPGAPLGGEDSATAEPSETTAE
ncbi:CRAL TRIO domain-containing protein, putative [Babesia ovata]|uniref:CRAL TRIO domain-containing protein, putative n=1 Tax=Babesia ovata TaxID=189622 RepID=A0A2H6KES0_9APIC|nr:CRAL TRIO domain-containing protein, putative [Babesia ovata]GBE61485.1 CRAL TRIO domain-containing protein, putative [Babesia ovata]